jgi:hypothetical protein
MSVINNQTARAFPYSSFIPFYINGLGLSNDAVAPNTILDVATGSTLDSTGTFQMSLSTATTISSAVSGLGGLDTGTITASKMYAVYLVSDPVTQQATGAMISLSLTGPLMPFGYNAYSLIGYVAVDNSSNFLKGYWTDNDSQTRTFIYDAPQATAVTAGASTAYAGVALTKFVPATADLVAIINTSFVPAAASRVLTMQGGNSTGSQVLVTGQVAAVVVTTQSFLMSQLVATVPTINYKVSNADSNVAVNVAGYQFTL